jgi:DNA-binding PadR family transcriptional regulator
MANMPRYALVSKSLNMPEVTRHAILGMVRRRPTYGYRLHDRLLQRWPSGDVFAPNQRTVYKILKSLEDDGLVQGSDVPVDGRTRRRFEVTPEGSRRYADWLSSDPETFAELILRLATATEEDLPLLIPLVVAAQHRLLELHSQLDAPNVGVLLARAAPWSRVLASLLEMVEYKQVASRVEILHDLRRTLEDVQRARPPGSSEL